MNYYIFMYLKRIQKVKKIIFMEYEKSSRQKSCGRKNFFIISILMFTIASMLCGMAKILSL